MTDDEQQARFQARLLRRRIDRMADGWWLTCPTHGRAPVDPYQPSRCAFCVVGLNAHDAR